MNIVSIFNYDFTQSNNLYMALMWFRGIVDNTSEDFNLHILSERKLPDNLIGYMNNECPTCNFTVIPRKNEFNHHNIDFKLRVLSELEFQFIFLDADMFICGDLKYLWEKRNDKPWIGINHQSNIRSHTDFNNLKFLNSGVQIVGEPSFYNYSEIIKTCESVNFKFKVPGMDQAALWTHFTQIGYDYTHNGVDESWNSCAGYSVVEEDELANWVVTYNNGDDSYLVNINHYWNEFKPWNIGCPIFKFYKRYSPL